VARIGSERSNNSPGTIELQLLTASWPSLEGNTMLLADIKERISRLDPSLFTAFVEALVSAEASRIGMDPSAVVISDQITVGDGGLDAVLRRPSPAGSVSGVTETAIPEGETGLQLKATKKTAPSAFELDTELRKPGPKRILSGGHTYVLVSCLDLNPGKREALESALSAEASRVAIEEGLPDDHVPRTLVWDAQTLAGLCMIHRGVAVAAGLDELGEALSLPEVLTALLRAESRPFQSDDARQRTIERIRERAESATGDALLLQVHGDPGVGKTRTVAEALDVKWATGCSALRQRA
jgi:hypothetical protein